MKRRNMTRNALFTSIIAMLVCVSMLVGATFAWFTDEVVSDRNTIAAGNLDVKLEYVAMENGAFNEANYAEVTAQTKVFAEGAQYEPGYTELVKFKVTNVGSLALKYTFDAVAYSEQEGTNVDGNQFKLSDYLYTGLVAAEDYTTREAAVAYATNTLASGINMETDGVLLAPGANKEFVLVLTMPTTVGNVANYRDVQPQIQLGVRLYATQFTKEMDSFDENYDKEAVIIVTSPAVALPGAGEAATDQNLATTVGKKVEVTLPAALMDDLAQEAEAPASVALMHTEPRIKAADNMVIIDQIELVDENGEVIDLEALSNDKPITVKFNVGAAFNVGDTVLVYHDGELIATVVVDADKNITYTATHFCEVVVGFNDGQINTAKEFLNTINGVQDGDVIKLAGNICFDAENRTHNSGTWYDGSYYDGDKSFIIDLGGYTITSDSSVNDYLLNFRNAGEKANTITIKNGTLEAPTSVYSAVCTSGTSTQKITINLENVELVGNNSNGAVAKIRGGAELNVKAGTVITGKDNYLCIECVASTVNIFDGAEIYQNGTSSYLGGLVGVCGGGEVNVYGGTGTSAKCGFVAMTSGGTINVSGGEWIANTDGTVGDNSNLYVLTSQNNSYESGYVGASIINVTGGTFRGGMDAWILNTNRGEVAELNISGGNFNANPARYLASGCQATEVNGNWVVGTNNLT